MKMLAVLPAVLACSTAWAQDVSIKPNADLRLRYEHVDQDGLPREADALTLRARLGVTAARGPWSALVEGEAVLALNDRYNDGLNGRTAYPLVADPGNLELNRAQLRYADKGGLAMTLGRQRIELADQRFVGSAPWRQSEQTFDAVRVQYGRPLGVQIDLTYAASLRTVNGRQGFGARPASVDGDNVFALLGYALKPGTLTAFAYLVDQDLAALQGYRLSSQTYGVRFAGATPIGKGARLGYTASWARQSDWHRNPNDYAATYALGEATLSVGGFNAAAGYEVLGADTGAALTSVQTPLSSLFKWNGWAGKFGTTPPDGLRDAYATFGHGWKGAGPFDQLSLSATLHRFDSDRAVRHYGDELDLLLSARRGKATVSARLAHYQADRWATDTDKFWLQLDWSY